MPDRAAIVTGASRGIGRAIAQALGEEGFALTITARNPDGLEQAASALSAQGITVTQLAANLVDEDAIRAVVERHRSTYGRLDVLVNSGGLGIGAAAGEHLTKYVDLQIDVNLRAIILLYRETLELLKATAAGGAPAHVINLASITGKSPRPWLSVYSATKAAIVAYTVAMNRELVAEGIRSTALCPGFVDTDMTDFIKGSVPPEQMIRTADVAEAVRFLLRLSPACVIPEIVFERPGETV